ncbi:MAG: sialidase [Candidatus Aminicenantes bacterium]|nr:sialidase [Candidatus Aminicenantes bacterium]
MTRLGMKTKKNQKIIILSLVTVLLFLGLSQGFSQKITPDVFRVLRYRHIGPPGNRTSAVVGVAGDPMIYYIGAASGGIWKSTDGGEHWDSVFDSHDVQSIGALAIAPSDPNVIWTGTGEAFVRSNISIGNGVYKSTDAGKTWKHMGLDKTGRIGRVAIDPRDPDIVFVAAMGHCYGPQKQRGVFRTKDGGQTWKQVLFVDEHTGCFEIAMDPNNPRILFAGMWPLVIRTWGRESGGPNGGIWKSADGGDTWIRLIGNGLPEPPIGKVGIAIAPSNSDVVYALIETGYPNRGVLWRSSDGGEHWRIASYNRLLNERPHYASRVMVNPADENEVYFAANSQSRTFNGGYTSETVPWGGDCHDMWADPENPNRMMISNDGGAMITLNRGKSWKWVHLPIAQMYHVAVDNQVPYYVYGGRQDGSAYKGPSTGSISRWGTYNSLWEATAGGECGFVIPDPMDPDIVWGGSYNADLQRANYKTGHINTVHVWPESIYGSHANAVKYRFNWTFPIHISPHDHNKVYVGSQYIHMTNNKGRSWELISPDLTTNDPSKMGPSGGLTRDNLAVEYGCCVFAIAESPLEQGCIWVGSNDGLVHVTRDGGENWTDVTANFPDLPEWGTVSNIEPSRYKAGTAYITIDFHQMNNRKPYVYKTEDYGKTWKSLSSDIPQSVFSYAHWIHEDPKRKGLLYLGTENSIYVSFDDGSTWLSLQSNLPHAPVHHMVVQKDFNDLVVGTYGRGFWIMDDITPLQQLNEDVLETDIHFFKPKNTYRIHSKAGGPYAFARAYLDYYLKEDLGQSIQFEIRDENGDLVNTLRGTSHKGINRVTWNLRHFPAEQAKLRTKPPGNPHVVEEKRFLDLWEREGWYPVLSWGTYGGFRGFLAAPGTYTVLMKVGDIPYTQEFKVIKDPNSEGTVSGIKEQVVLQKKIRTELNTVSSMINQIEWMRQQLYDLSEIQSHEKNKDMITEINTFDQTLRSVEDELLQPILAEGDSKSFRYPNKLYCKLSVLAGDVAGSADFAPNEQQKAVYAELKKRLEKQKQIFQNILDEDLPAFNSYLQKNGMAGIIVPKMK